MAFCADQITAVSCSGLPRQELVNSFISKRKERKKQTCIYIKTRTVISGRERQTVVGSELRSCVKVEVAVLGSPPLMSLTVSVDVKRH